MCCTRFFFMDRKYIPTATKNHFFLNQSSWVFWIFGRFSDFSRFFEVFKYSTELIFFFLLNYYFSASHIICKNLRIPKTICFQLNFRNLFLKNWIFEDFSIFKIKNYFKYLFTTPINAVCSIYNLTRKTWPFFSGTL